MTGTLNLIDIYGSNPPGSQRSGDTDKTTIEASGGANDATGAAISWVGIILILVLIRLLQEYNPGGIGS
jgi:hypothetical protein